MLVPVSDRPPAPTFECTATFGDTAKFDDTASGFLHAEKLRSISGFIPGIPPFQAFPDAKLTHALSDRKLYRFTSLKRNKHPPGPCSRTILRAL